MALEDLAIRVPCCWAASGLGGKPSAESAAGGFGCELGSGRDSELGEDVREVDLHGPTRDEHTLADLWVGESLGDEFDHLELGRSEGFPAARGSSALTAAATRRTSRMFVVRRW